MLKKLVKSEHQYLKWVSHVKYCDSHGHIGKRIELQQRQILKNNIPIYFPCLVVYRFEKDISEHSIKTIFTYEFIYLSDFKI